MNDIKPVVFYVPGLYSSTLRPSEGLGCLNDNQWNPPRSLTATLARGNKGHQSLKLPITWSIQTRDDNDDGVDYYVQDKDDVQADDCLYFVQGKLLNTLDTLHKNGMIELHKIVWDWRRSFEEAEQHISETIESIINMSSSFGTNNDNDSKNNNKNNNNYYSKAIVVTHSTGALLTWPTICRHPEYFSCWVNAAGCLLKGSNMFLAEFQHGYSLYSGIIRMLSKEAFFTFAGLYSYFPTKGEEGYGGMGDSDWVDADGKTFRTDIDIYKVETWEEYKLGIFEWKKGQVTEEERSHIQHCLDAAKRFRETHLVKKEKEKKKGTISPHDASFLDKDLEAYGHLKIICYGTDKLQAHSAYQVDVTEKTLDVSSSKLTTSGDGTLFSSNWKTVPGGLEREIVMAEEGSNHVSLVNDAKLQTLLLDCFFADDEMNKASAKTLLKL
ncbi:MAG: hypothetical protein SGBAC_009682 [Bacillariaceae sp.]